MDQLERDKKFVKGLGWFTVAVAALGLLIAGLQSALWSYIASQIDLQELFQEMVASDELPAFFVDMIDWLQPILLSASAVCMILLVTGFGLVKIAPWARWSTLILLILGVIGHVIGLIMSPWLVDQMMPLIVGGAPFSESTRQAFRWGYLGSSILTNLASAGVLAWLAYKINTPAIKAAFKS